MSGLGAGEKSRVAAGLLHLANEHQQSILSLANDERYGSVYALARPLLEAFVRGVWLYRCASDEDVESFRAPFSKNGRAGKAPGFERILRAIETTQDWPYRRELSTAILQKQGKDGCRWRVWDAMCDWTHGGFQHAVRRNHEDAIDSNYEIEGVVQVIDFANTIGS